MRYDKKNKKNLSHRENTIIFGNGNKYTGEINQNVFHGWGRFESTDGEWYQGNWKNGVKDDISAKERSFVVNKKTGEKKLKESKVFYSKGKKNEVMSSCCTIM